MQTRVIASASTFAAARARTSHQRPPRCRLKARYMPRFEGAPRALYETRAATKTNGVSAGFNELRTRCRNFPTFDPSCPAFIGKWTACRLRVHSGIYTQRTPARVGLFSFGAQGGPVYFIVYGRYKRGNTNLGLEDRLDAAVNGKRCADGFRVTLGR